MSYQDPAFRTIRNSVLSYANDGQVFTADFQCDYPIDVTAVEYVEPVKKQDVKFKQKIVTVGLSRKSFIILHP